MVFWFFDFVPTKTNAAAIVADGSHVRSWKHSLFAGSVGVASGIPAAAAAIVAVSVPVADSDRAGEIIILESPGRS